MLMTQVWRLLMSTFRWVFLFYFTLFILFFFLQWQPLNCTPWLIIALSVESASFTELLSVKSAILPSWPLKALCMSKPLHYSISLLSFLFTLNTLDISCGHTSLASTIYFTSPPAPAPTPSSHHTAMWACDPLNPLYPGLRPTWPRADYILDITMPDVYDKNKQN